MIDNKDTPAYPQPIAECSGGISEIMDYNNQSVGLSKREYFAAMALQGLLASWGNHDCNGYEEIAADAVLAADKLLTELSKTQS